jgi:hypothetical protein
MAVPPAVVIDTAPVTASGITMPTKVVPSLDTAIASTPPIGKAVGLLRLVPVMVTKVPTGPKAGVKEVMVGACALATWHIAAKNSRRMVRFFILIVE